MIRRARREFDARFKLQVVRMVKDQGLLLADINHPNNLLSETLVAGGYSGAGCEDGTINKVRRLPLIAARLRNRDMAMRYKKRLRVDSIHGKIFIPSRDSSAYTK